MSVFCSTTRMRAISFINYQNEVATNIHSTAPPTTDPIMIGFFVACAMQLRRPVLYPSVLRYARPDPRIHTQLVIAVLRSDELVSLGQYLHEYALSPPVSDRYLPRTVCARSLPFLLSVLPGGADLTGHTDKANASHYR